MIRPRRRAAARSSLIIALLASMAYIVRLCAFTGQITLTILHFVNTPSELLCYNVGTVTATFAALIQKIARELEPLLESGDNWQLSVHGGHGGDVQLETRRVCKVSPCKDCSTKAKVTDGG